MMFLKHSKYFVYLLLFFTLYSKCEGDVTPKEPTLIDKLQNMSTKIAKSTKVVTDIASKYAKDAKIITIGGTALDLETASNQLVTTYIDLPTSGIGEITIDAFTADQKAVVSEAGELTTTEAERKLEEAVKAKKAMDDNTEEGNKDQLKATFVTKIGEAKTEIEKLQASAKALLSQATLLALAVQNSEVQNLDNPTQKATNESIKAKLLAIFEEIKTAFDNFHKEMTAKVEECETLKTTALEAEQSSEDDKNKLVTLVKEKLDALKLVYKNPFKSDVNFFTGATGSPTRPFGYPTSTTNPTARTFDTTWETLLAIESVASGIIVAETIIDSKLEALKSLTGETSKLKTLVAKTDAFIAKLGEITETSSYTENFTALEAANTMITNYIAPAYADAEKTKLDKLKADFAVIDFTVTESGSPLTTKKADAATAANTSDQFKAIQELLESIDTTLFNGFKTNIKAINDAISVWKTHKDAVAKTE